MAPLGEEYARGLQRAFAERWIDLYPNKGKQSGGYSMGIYRRPSVHQDELQRTL